MQILVSFAPWIVYSILGSTVGWPLSVAGALAVALVVLAYNYRTGRPVDVLSIGGVAFFVALLVASPMLGQGIEAHTQTLSHGWIAVVMWLSIVLRNPFTEVFARSEAPAEMVGTPQFLRFNNIISAMWAASFTVGTLALAATQWNGIGSVVVVVASIVVPIVAMNRYIAVVTADDHREEAVNA